MTLKDQELIEQIFDEVYGIDQSENLSFIEHIHLNFALNLFADFQNEILQRFTSSSNQVFLAPPTNFSFHIN